jgi:hypothetical protein
VRRKNLTADNARTGSIHAPPFDGHPAFLLDDADHAKRADSGPSCGMALAIATGDDAVRLPGNRWSAGQTDPGERHST